MIVSVLSESTADEAAVRILVEGVLGETAEPDGLAPLRIPGGWNSVVANLPTVIRAVYYQSDAEVLAVVLDSDKSAVHDRAHDSPDAERGDCRLCRVRQRADDTLAQLRARPGRGDLYVAVGLAVPCIKAWYRCGVDPHVNEAAWILAMASQKFPY
jgi:hypothetical protein